MDKDRTQAALRATLTSMLLWAYCVLMLGLYRVAFVAYFSEKISHKARGMDYLLCLINGLRFDSVVSTYVILLPFILGLLSLRWSALNKLSSLATRVLGGMFFLATAVILPIAIKFFIEYDDVFNSLVFGLWLDDTRAIVSTVWKEYHPIATIIVMATLFYLMLLLWKRMMAALNRAALPELKSPAQKTIALALAVVFIFFAMRGSLGRRPVQRHDAAITRDVLLNKAIVNPFFALKYAFKDFMQLNSSEGLEHFIGNKGIRDAVREVYGNDDYDSLGQYLTVKAKGSGATPPKDIYFIVVESYDTWPLLDKYASLGLTKGLKSLEAEGGILIRDFIPASFGTMNSMLTILSGVPFTGVPFNYHASSLKEFPTATAGIFRRLGYKTRFFYGGNLSWQHVGRLASAQGFDEVYGGPDMSGGVSFNEWGLNDEYVYSFVLDKAREDTGPTFNLILTTTYHPPYDVDVYGKGFKLKEMPADLRDVYDNPEVNLNILGHLWYADKSVADFIRATVAASPESVFAVTGDHFGRKHISLKPPLYEKATVPLLLYGKNVPDSRGLSEPLMGSHLDIGPTLIEMAAPEGFAYQRFGRDILSHTEDAMSYSDLVFMKQGRMIFRGSGPIDLIGFKEAGKQDPKEARHEFMSRLATGWWEVMCGDSLKQENCK